MAKSTPKKNIVTFKNEKAFPFFIAGLFFILLSWFFSFFPDITRGWGLNYIKFFSTPVITLYYLLLFCFWFPPVNNVILKVITRLSQKTNYDFLRKYKYLWFAIIGVTFGILFYLLKIKYIFLGDLDIRAKQIEEGFIIPDEYLTMLFFKHAYSFLNAKFEFTGLQTIQLFDYVTGSIYIFISLCISSLMGDTFLKKTSIFIAGILSSTILLQFCGYAEIYAFPVLFLLLYLFSCILHLKRKVRIYIPLLVLAAGMGAHLMLVCMLPSFVFLFYRSVLWKYEIFRKRITLIVISLISLLFIYFAALKYALPYILPFSPGEHDMMTMFSVSHFIEFFNSQVLASGIGFFIWLITIIHSLINRIKYDITQWFFLVASVSVTGLMFVFNALRGSGDWDILAFAAVVYNLSNVFFLIKLYDNKLYTNIKYGILMICGISGLHTSMWIITNKTDISINWVEQAITTDPANYYKLSFNNEAMMAELFSTNKLEKKALEWVKKSYQKHNEDPRMGFNYAKDLFDQNQYNEAVIILEDLVNKFPYYPLSYSLLLRIYVSNNDDNSIYRVLLKMEEAYFTYADEFNAKISKEQMDRFFTLLNRMREEMK